MKKKIKIWIARFWFRKALRRWELVMEKYGCRVRVSRAPQTVFNARQRAFAAFDHLQALDPTVGRWTFREQIRFEMQNP